MGCGGSKAGGEENGAGAPPPTSNGAPPADKAATENKQLLSEYVLGDVLGQGAFGVVYACAKKGTKDYVWAVKMVDKVETPVAEIKKEAQMMKELAHPNVVKFEAVYFEKCFVCIVMEKYGGGDLIEGMQLHWKSKGKIPPFKVVHIVRGMAAAIHHCHSNLYIHRDVKGDNYLTDRKDITDPGCRVLMSDFGTALKLKSPTDRCKNSCGTKVYWPPEFFSLNYSFKVDVWAFGVIMYGLIDGRFPFKGEADARNKVIKLPSSCPPKCQHLVLKCLEKSENDRYDSTSLISDEWVAQGPAGEGDQKEDTSGGFTADTLREGGANGGQDERRKELIERLEKQAEKGSKTGTQMAVLWGSRFDVHDKRTGKSLRYEWWPQDKFNEQGVLDLTHAVKAGNDVGKVEPKVIAKTLTEHGIDINEFGKGENKTLDEFAAEVHSGAAILMLDAAEHKKLVRVVDVVLLRIRFGDGGNKKYLCEFSETFADGRARSDLNRLPGSKKEPHENTRKAVERILKDQIDIKNVPLEIDYSSKEVFEEEEMSRSYPGVRTVYRKEIVEAVVPQGGDGAAQTKLGLQGNGQFAHTSGANNTKVFKWFSQAECQQKGIKLTAPKDGEEVSGLVQAPIAYTEEDLIKFLGENKIDVELFGRNNAKTLRAFTDELTRGDSSLMVTPEGKVVRTVDVVVLILKKQGVGDILVEVSEKQTDGSMIDLKRLPGSKRRPDENQFVAAQRVLRRQLKMDENFVTIDASDVKVVEEQKDSPSYPGIDTIYRKRIISAELLKVS
eukprot:TRINITY_DN517_c0_g2_i1.p1 TRINITY_DN517_c0_g2~~TRINITY_DN517_c0_g2_i1.p1  ORF type:complete len:781 (+),score=265.18 TRINITY_DN517_c0_g2_i1:145-2487(+)